jgi:hypothetical protein
VGKAVRIGETGEVGVIPPRSVRLGPESAEPESVWCELSTPPTPPPAPPVPPEGLAGEWKDSAALSAFPL